MEMTIEEIIAHCDRQLSREPKNSVFYREHEAVKAFLVELQEFRKTGLEPQEIKEHEAEYIEIMTRTYGPLHQKIGQWLQAKRTGRLVILPEVSEKDRKLFADGLHDYFLEAKLYDPSVGIFGMTDGETALADALMEVLEEKDGEG